MVFWKEHRVLPIANLKPNPIKILLFNFVPKFSSRTVITYFWGWSGLEDWSLAFFQSEKGSFMMNGMDIGFGCCITTRRGDDGNIMKYSSLAKCCYAGLIVRKWISRTLNISHWACHWASPNSGSCRIGDTLNYFVHLPCFKSCILCSNFGV